MQNSSIKQIIKRSGEIVEFNPKKLEKAIYKATVAIDRANKALAKKLAEDVVTALNEKFHARSIPAVEDVQDIVEKIIINNNHTKIAKAYIIYRDQHRQLRDISNIEAESKMMEDYLARADWRLNENSNMSFSVQGLNNYLSSSVSAKYWLNKLYPQEVRSAHINGDIHIHDLGMLAPYCCGWDLKDLLIRGFGGVGEKIQSKPPRHFRSALGQMVNFLYTLQGEAAGAQAFANFDTYLAPFVRYDGLDYKEVKQAIQEFVFNLNVPTRVGFQSPFTNITMDVVPSGMTKDEKAIVGGEVMSETYGDFQEEMDMINKSFAEVMLEGDSTGKVFSFPIPTYNIDKNFDWDKKSLEPMWQMTAKYGIPYFSNFINSDMDVDDARSMCCRLRLDNRELRKRGGGLFGANPQTGSLGVVTINLARIGFLAKDKEDFKKQLFRLMDLAKESLEIKRKVIEKYSDDKLYPYSSYYLKNIKERFGTYWQNHFNTIGVNGMNEALVNFIQKDISTQEGKELAEEVMDIMRNKLMDYQTETNNLYNLEASPAEGATYRFAKKDKELYPEIIVANNEVVNTKGADPYYTNSTHLPVGHTEDIFSALDLQDNLQTKYTGGTVLHGFIGERIRDVQSCKMLVKKIAESYHLPYFTITPTFSICPKHGYLEGEHQYCPKCDQVNNYQDNQSQEVFIEDEVAAAVEQPETIINKIEKNNIEDSERSLVQAMA